jgi:hypothetical protein
VLAHFPGIVIVVPTILAALSDMPAKAVTFRRKHRSTSSDSAVIIRRKPWSPSVGIHNNLQPAFASSERDGLGSA